MNRGKNNLEKRAVATANLRRFVLPSPNLTGEEMAEIFLSAIVKMQEVARQNQSPFLAKIYPGGRIQMWKNSQKLLEELSRFSNQEREG